MPVAKQDSKRRKKLCGISLGGQIKGFSKQSKQTTSGQLVECCSNAGNKMLAVPQKILVATNNGNDDVIVIPDAPLASWPELRYHQTDEVWQQEKCKQLGFRFHCAPNFQRGGRDIIYSHMFLFALSGTIRISVHPTKPHFNTLNLVSLLFAPPILHPTNHFLDREVFDLLVPLIFFLCQVA